MKTMIFISKIYLILTIISIASLGSVNAGSIKFQTIDYMPNDQNKVGAVELLDIKHLSDGLTSINFKGKVFEPISPETVTTTFYSKSTADGKFVNTTALLQYDLSFDFCEAMAGKNSNMYIRGVVATIKFIAPSMVHDCPYKGLYEINNEVFDSRVINVAWPLAEYKVEIKVLHKNDVIFYSNVFFEIIPAVAVQ